MIDITLLESDLASSTLSTHSTSICDALTQVLPTLKHGDLTRWQTACDSLPATPLHPVLLDRAEVTVGSDSSLSESERDALKLTLKEFIPWRKGPFSIAGIPLDTEWRSDFKWQRLLPHIQPLKGRTVLDVGCGNGYHMWRMVGSGADLVLGVDPTLLFLYQFKCVKSLTGSTGVHLLPLRLDQLPGPMQCFDTVFSMGVLYHRRDPLQHLQQLRQALLPSGELVLETLVSPESEPITLSPGQRYARMRNVWALPTTTVLVNWLEESGFSDVRIVSDQTTTVAEQRTTDWMPFDSLEQALDPGDKSRTIEGLPSPRRVIALANKPAHD